MKYNYSSTLVFLLSLLIINFGFSKTTLLESKTDYSNSIKKEASIILDFSKSLKEPKTTSLKETRATTKKHVLKSGMPKKQTVVQNKLAWTSADTCPTCDFDGDGIANNVDIDDDNDGILDAVEAPSCYYTQAGAGQIAKVSTGLGSSTVNSTAVVVGNNIPTMYDTTSTSVAASNHVVATNQLGTTSTVIYNIEYTGLVNIATVNVVGATASWGTGAFAVLEGSTDGTSYTTLSAPLAISAGTTKTWTNTINPTGLYKYYRIRVSTVGSTQPAFTNYEITSTLGATSNYSASANPKPTCSVDTDGDGLTNDKDLDSDGDGCPDASESGVTGTLLSGNVINGTPNTTNIIANAVAQGPYGTNGLANTLENNDTVVAVTSYISTYQYATSSILNACTDNDGDGIGDLVDIDDDNDGILDVVEAPSCYYTVTEASIITAVSSELPTFSGSVVATIDGISTGSSYNQFNAQAWAGKEIYKVTAANPLIISGLSFDINTNPMSNTANSTFRLQGSNDNTVWTDLSEVLSSTAVSGTYTVPNSLQPNTFYKYYRLLGVVGSTSGAIWELHLLPSSSLVASSYPEPTCSVDTDGDGLTNDKDLDSDGDGCPDAKEASVPGTLLAGNVINGTPNTTTNTASAIAQGAYGANGLANSLENNDTATATTSYTNTYKYALSSVFNACNDTDGDGISDLVDIDNDNDGILDVVEAPSCYYTASEGSIISKVSTALANDDGVNVDLPFMHDSVTTNVTASNNIINSGQAFLGETIYNIEYPVSVVLSTLTVTGAASWGTNSTAVLEGSNEGSTWTTLSASTATTGTTKTFTNTLQTSTDYKYYRVRMITNSSIPAPAITTYEVAGIVNTPSNYSQSANPKPTCSVDTDGDGITNDKDLDSDGDGCPDAKESGVTGTLLLGNVINGTPNTTTSVSNAVAQGPYGSNGLANSLENNDTAFTTTSYTNTYQYATSATTNACVDAGGNGIGDLVDIDDDNDGILDVVEAPSCYYTVTEASIITAVSSELPTYSGSVVATIDGISTGSSYNQFNAQAWAGKEIYKVTAANPLIISGLSFDINTNPMSNGANSTFRLQGSNDNTAWTDLSEALSSTAVSGTFTVPNSLQPNAFYKYYRLLGVVGSTSGAIWELHLLPSSSLVASSYPKPTCNVDTDGDGITNDKDLDSDGDGCPDAKEAGVTGTLLAGNIVNGTPNTTTNVSNAVAQGPYGTNGLANSLENNDTTSATTSYTSTYNVYALSKFLNVCSDTDTDGVSDIVDIDDDNDGILDATEAPSCYYTATEMTVPSLITSEISTTGTISNLYDNSTATTFAFTATSAANALNKSVFEITPIYPQVATSIALNLTSTTIFGALNGTTASLKAQGWNGNNWVDLATYAALPAVTGGIQTFTFTNTTPYSKYRILDSGTTGVNITASVIKEVTLGLPASYNASSNPKATCSVDTDGDGILNQFDLDSDNDGCSDAFEAGVTVVSGVSMTTNNSVVAAPYGANGLADSVETATESGVYKSTYTYANATNNTIHTCPCPTITGTVTNPTTCGGSDGTLKLCGLIPFNGGNTVTYSKDGGATETLTNQTSDASGCITITGLSAGNYTAITVITLSCAGTTPIALTILENAPNAGTLSGTQAICTSGATTFTSNGDAGGAWSSSDTAVATVNASGVVTGVGAGTATITYTVTGTAPCADATATRTVTVTQDTVAGTISSDQTICKDSMPVALTLTGNVGSVVKWQKATDVAFTTPVDIASTATTLSSTDMGSLAATTYYRAVVQSGSCSTLYSNVVTVTVPYSTWNGTAWSNGIPTIETTVTFTGNYSSSSDLFACSVTVTNNANVVINSGNDYTVYGKVTVDSGSTFEFKNDANLIQITGVQNSGNIIVRRNTIALSRLDYKLWSTPVMTQQLLAFTPQTLTDRFYKYNSAISNYSIVAASSNFELGKGYLIRMPNNFPAYPATNVFSGTFTGVPNNGDITVAISNTGDKFTSIGNPYPSTINPMNFVTTNSNNITGTLYIWRKRNNTNYLPGYITWAGGTMTGNGEPGTFSAGLDYIQIGQGFLVESKNGASSVLFNNQMRVGNNGGISFKNSNAIEYNRIWLNLTSTTTTEFNQMVVGYITDATLDVDIFDGKNINNTSVLLCSLLNNENYTIQGRPLPFADSDVVPLLYKVTTAGNYTIGIDHVDGLFEGANQDIFIKDNLTNTYNNLNTSPYTFASDAGTFNNRFELVYRSSSLSTTNNSLTSNQVVVYKNNEDIVINTGNIQMATVKIFDVRGRLLAEKNNINATETKMKAGLANEVLLVQIKSIDGTTVVKKMMN